MCVEYNCWKLSPAFRKNIRLEKPCMNVFPGFSQVQDPRGIISDSEDFSDSDPTTMPKLKLKARKKVVWFDSKTVPAVPVTEPVPMTDIDLLNRHVEELAHEKQRLLQELASSCNPSVNTAE